MGKNVNLIQGDCLEKLKNIPDNSVDCIITDPPYGIDFKHIRSDNSGLKGHWFPSSKKEFNLELKKALKLFGIEKGRKRKKICKVIE